MTHEPRLTHALRSLISTHRVAALGTLDENGLPFVSMVPFAVDLVTGFVVIHVSGLASHTRNLVQQPKVSVLIMQAEASNAPVHALPRVTLEGIATTPQHDSAPWSSAKTAYLARFPEAQPMTELGDFRFVTIAVTSARQVAGFGAARSLQADEIAQVLRPSTNATIMRPMSRPS
jgi:putative heme iron utilization protein